MMLKAVIVETRLLICWQAGQQCLNFKNESKGYCPFVADGIILSDGYGIKLKPVSKCIWAGLNIPGRLAHIKSVCEALSVLRAKKKMHYKQTFQTLGEKQTC